MNGNGTRSKRLGFERLEDRALMAGNVTATVTNGYLSVIGDDLSNSVALESTATAGVYRVYGLPSAAVQTKINNVDMSVTGSFVEVTGVTQGVTIDLRGGDDQLTFGSLAQPVIAFPRWLKIDTGTGDDQVELGRAQDNLAVGAVAVSVRTDLSINTGAGDDTVSVANLIARKGVQINTGDGDDHVLFLTSFVPTSGSEQFFPVVIQRDLTIRLGEGSDELTGSNLRVGENLTIIDGGGGDTTITLTDSTIVNKMKMSLGEDIDVIALDHIVAFQLGMNTNEGADDVTIRNSRFKRVDIDLGSANDRLTVGQNRVSQYTKLDGGIARADLFDEGGNAFRNRIRRRF